MAVRDAAPKGNGTESWAIPVHSLLVYGQKVTYNEYSKTRTYAKPARQHERRLSSFSEPRWHKFVIVDHRLVG